MCALYKQDEVYQQPLVFLLCWCLKWWPRSGLKLVEQVLGCPTRPRRIRQGIPPPPSMAARWDLLLHDEDAPVWTWWRRVSGLASHMNTLAAVAGRRGGRVGRFERWRGAYARW